LDDASGDYKAEVMKAEDPLFILDTSGSAEQPKGMVHNTAVNMLYTAYTFKNVFQYKEDDVYWSAADIGWIIGYSYLVYVLLANGATAVVIFEGVPINEEAMHWCNHSIGKKKSPIKDTWW
jgi:acetyl-CoA synthetase